MKTRTRELAKPGIYGTVENPVVVSERDLREIAETFPDVKRAPISLNGHWPDPAAPRLGNVVAISFDEATKILSGTMEEQDVLAEAVDQGFFPDCSIGSRRRASDGKQYLHHLAYLGEEPPAVKNLISDISRSLDPGSQEDLSVLAAADSGSVLMFPPSSAKLLNLSDPSATSGGDPIKNKEIPMPKTIEEVQAELKSAVDENTNLKATLAEFTKKYPDSGIKLSDSADPRIDDLVKQVREGKKTELLRAASGKIPKAKQDLVLALADSFSTGESIELSDGEKKVNRSQFEILSDLFDGLPRLVEPGKIDLGDGNDDSRRGSTEKPASIPFSKA